MDETALIAAAFLIGTFFGWKLRGYLHSALVTVVWRLIVGEEGKEKCLRLIDTHAEALLAAIKKART